MSLLLPSQLNAIRAADFDFNACFLDRIAVAVDDYLAAGGMTAAGPSPGPLHEIVENHALLVEIIAGANAHTSDADRTRVSGIKGLSVRLESLREFCQEFAGMSVEALAATQAAPDKFDAAWLNTVADGIAEYVRAVSALVSAGGAPDSDPRTNHGFVGDVIESALASAAHDDPAKAEAIERLTALRDDLRELIG